MPFEAGQMGRVAMTGRAAVSTCCCSVQVDALAACWMLACRGNMQGQHSGAGATFRGSFQGQHSGATLPSLTVFNVA